MVETANFGPGGFLSKRSPASALLFAVPRVSARTLGLYRILFGTLFLGFYLLNMEPDRLGDLAASGSRFYLNSWSLLSELSAAPLARSAIYYAIALALCLFTVGLFTRVAFAGLVLGFWILALLSNDGHFVTPLLLAITVTVNAPWGEGLSLDRLLSRRGGDEGSRSQEFGYPIWLMGLCISLAYTAAGLSKLVLTDGAWLWEGGARWGFMTDIHEAATLLGPIIVDSLPLAILASVFAAFGQIAYIYSCFTRSLLIKTAIGLFVAVPFLVGLMLLMGLFWWPWFTLVALWFLPWSRIDALVGDRRGKPAMERAPRPRSKAWACTAALALILGHGWVVAKKIELEPLISSYPMYAVAFPMGSELEEERWQDFEADKPDFLYEVSVETGDGRVTDISHRLRFSVVYYRLLGYSSSYRRLDPQQPWALAERRESDSGLCDLQRKVLHAFDPRESRASLIYRRRYFDVIGGRFVWMYKGKSLRVSVEPGGCHYAWLDHEA